FLHQVILFFFLHSVIFPPRRWRDARFYSFASLKQNRQKIKPRRLQRLTISPSGFPFQKNTKKTKEKPPFRAAFRFLF
ncbi:MAG: hypothetical protein KGI60_04945, partial [Patescibacteria group bacterium]|nr:hypothetical protein [Patescibacteria group bacterium]